AGRALPPPRPPSAAFHEPPLHRPTRQLVAVGELELAQNRRDVRLDRLRRDPEAERDLLVEVAASEVAQHLALTRREVVERGVVARAVVAAARERLGGR